MIQLNLFKLAVKYLKGHYRRYIFLFAALSLGFGVITSIISVSSGMIDNIYSGAELHYGGHLFVLGFDKDHDTAIRITDDKAVTAAVEATGLEYEKTVRRTNCFERGTLYFNGRAVRQKNVFGIDIKNESENFDISFVSDYSRPWIILSRLSAEELHVKKGDLLILEVDTITGQKNTAECIVADILNDTSLFGAYRSFTDRSFLNSLMGMGVEEYSSLGLYFKNLRGIEEKAAILHSYVSASLPSAPAIDEKAGFSFELSQSWQGIRYFTISLPVYISEAADLIRVLEAGSYLVFAVMALILLASSLVTYRLVLHERRLETATMRAIGFHSAQIFRIFLLEGVMVAVSSIIAGFLLSRLIILILGLFSYGSIPGFEIFLKDGRLTTALPPVLLFVNIAVVFLVVGLALVFPARKSLNRSLAEALAGGDF